MEPECRTPKSSATKKGTFAMSNVPFFVGYIADLFSQNLGYQISSFLKFSCAHYL
jgi:hypothetical protein